MPDQLGTVERPLRVAIIGAGPAGFYAAGGLLQQKNVPVNVDMFERLAAPYGLVRYGVAPDHQKIKAVSKVFERTAADPRFRFFGNVDLGLQLSLADLRPYYDQIVYAVGAPTDRHLNIPGEELAGSLSSTAFVAWYNGHPEYVDLPVNLQVESAVVVGVGNVAMDVARILAKSTEELATTDIADHALAVLHTSQIKTIHILARRGPAQAKFTPQEIKEFGELANADVIVDPAELQLDAASAAEAAADPEIGRNLEHLRAFAAQSPQGKARQVYFHFLVSPVALLGEAGRVTAVKVERNQLVADGRGNLNARSTGEIFTLPAGLVLRAVGYKGTPLAGLPYDERSGTIPNRLGRIIDPVTEVPLSGQYVVGWAKRGPFGVIGTNRPDALETVQQMLADVAQTTPAPIPDPAAVEALLRTHQIDFVTMAEWQVIDKVEIARGISRGQPRVKFVTLAEMLAARNAG
jgi:ferredoxin--NADP+ reductase